MPQEAIGCIVEHRAHRIFGAAHDALHAVDGAQVVAAVDAFAAAGADENVLVVVGHADHFMRHHLADGEDQVEAAFEKHAVHLRRPWKVELALRLLMDELGRNLAHGLDIRAPVVHAEQLVRHVAEHARKLIGPHRRMRAERRQNGLELIAVVLPDKAGEHAGLRMKPRDVRGYGKHVRAAAETGQAFHKQVVQLFRRKIAVLAANGAIEAHEGHSAFQPGGSPRLPHP